MGVERADELSDTVTVSCHRELQLFQGRRRLEPADEQRVALHLPSEAAQVFALGGFPRAEQLGQGVLAGELVPVAVVLDPDGAHEPSQLGREDDAGEHRRARRASRQRLLSARGQGRGREQGERDPHRFCRA